MSSRTPSVSAVIRLVNAPPAFRIDVVGPDPPPVLLLRPSAGWARSSAGPLLLDLRVVRSAPIHRSTVASLRVTGTRVLHNMQVVRLRVALRSSLAGVAFHADGCLPSGGRARSESVSASCAMVGWALSIGLIDLPFLHWTHVKFKHPPE
jgi:hypothetical protein